MRKCSHSNYNNCGKGIEKLVEAKEIARLSLEDQTVIQPEGRYKRREWSLCFFLLWSRCTFLLKCRGKQVLRADHASLCQANWWDDPAWGGSGGWGQEHPGLPRSTAVPAHPAECAMTEKTHCGPLHPLGMVRRGDYELPGPFSFCSSVPFPGIVLTHCYFQRVLS